MAGRVTTIRLEPQISDELRLRCSNVSRLVNTLLETYLVGKQLGEIEKLENEIKDCDSEIRITSARKTILLKRIQELQDREEQKERLRAKEEHKRLFEGDGLL